MDEVCICGSIATVHVVGATNAHGILWEEYWCDGCYNKERKSS